MTYGQVRDHVLMLLNQYTIAGSAVEPSYNNQQDYLARIPALVNDAMMEIATTARKLPAVLPLAGLPREEVGEEVRIPLPADFYQLVSGSVARLKNGRTVHTNCCAVQGRQYLLLPRDTAEDCVLTYWRYPNLLPEQPGDAAQLDNLPETHYAIPFYVASFLVSHDDPFLCSLFYNKYEDKLSKMSSGRTAEIAPVADCYGFGQGVGI